MIIFQLNSLSRVFEMQFYKRFHSTIVSPLNVCSCTRISEMYSYHHFFIVTSCSNISLYKHRSQWGKIFEKAIIIYCTFSACCFLLMAPR